MLERDVDFLDIFVLGRIMNDKKKIINFYELVTECYVIIQENFINSCLIFFFILKFNFSNI